MYIMQIETKHSKQTCMSGIADITIHESRLLRTLCSHNRRQYS